MNNQLQYSKDGLKLTESFEGCKLQSYKDIGGVWTIGYGHTFGVDTNSVCDQNQAELWLQQDIKWAEKIVNSYVIVQLNQNEFDALVDFVFNLGSGNFIKSRLLKLINLNNFKAALNEFEKWDHVSGKVIKGLFKRRLAEEQKFSSLNQV